MLENWTRWTFFSAHFGGVTGLLSAICRCFNKQTALDANLFELSINWASTRWTASTYLQKSECGFGLWLFWWRLSAFYGVVSQQMEKVSVDIVLLLPLWNINLLINLLNHSLTHFKYSAWLYYATLPYTDSFCKRQQPKVFYVLVMW